MRDWIICYDVSDARVRRSVAEVLADAGAQRVQESVFEGRFHEADLRRLLAQCHGVLIPGVDSLRAYALLGRSDGRTHMGSMPAHIGNKGLWIC